MSEDSIHPDITEVKPHFSEFGRFFRVLFARPLVLFGAIIVLVFLIVSMFGPWISPYDPNKQQLDRTLAGPSREYLLGTDELGRDTLSRVIYGARNSLMVGIVALGIASIIGMTAGLIAGYFSGWVFAVIMRIIDTMMSFPTIVLALFIASVLGGGLKNVMIAIGIAMIPGYARLMASLTLSAKESDYILAGRAMGSNDLRQMFRHILPNCFPPLIVMITMQIGLAILSEAGLSYLGIGITPPSPAWGAMVADGYLVLVSNPVLSFAPGLAIVLVVFGFNMLGDGLRDALDPRLRGVL